MFATQEPLTWKMIPLPTLISLELAIHLHQNAPELRPIPHPVLRIAIDALFNNPPPRTPTTPKVWTNRIRRTDSEEVLYRIELENIREACREELRQRNQQEQEQPQQTISQCLR